MGNLRRDYELKLSHKVVALELQRRHTSFAMLEFTEAAFDIHFAGKLHVSVRFVGGIEHYLEHVFELQLYRNCRVIMFSLITWFKAMIFYVN